MEEVVARRAESHIAVFVESNGQPLGLGLIAGDYALTCAHVIRNSRAFRIETFSARAELRYDASKIDFSDHDLALIPLEGPVSDAVEPVSFFTGDPFGFEYRIWGVPERYPDGVQAVGRIGRADRSGKQLMEPDSRSPYVIDRGFSGSPLFGPSGEVLGLTCESGSRPRDGNRLGRFIPSGTIVTTLPLLAEGNTEFVEPLDPHLNNYLNLLYEQEGLLRFVELQQQVELLDTFVDIPVALGDARLARQRAQRLQSPRSIGDEDYALGLSTFSNRSLDYYVHNQHRKALLCADLLLLASPDLMQDGLLLYGAPGQGKSTVTQYLAQIHRARLLGITDKRIPSHHYGPHRIPFRLDLRDVAAWRAGTNPFAPREHIREDLDVRHLENYIIFHINHILALDGDRRIARDDLQRFIQGRAILIVFDGLDEVADRIVREDISREIQAVSRRLRRHTASLHYIVTSRPDVYSQSDEWFEDQVGRAYLPDLGWDHVQEYSEKWMASLKLQKNRVTSIRHELEASYRQQDHIRALTVNPMQLTILLSLLNTSNAALPHQRTKLYEEYVGIFFKREAGKSNTIRAHGAVVLRFHGYLAWTLQAASEKLGHSGTYHEDQLREEIERYLTRAELDPGIADEIHGGVKERIMFLVKKAGDLYEFDVQTLREYFAAQHLSSGAPSPTRENLPATKPARFRETLANPYWINVARFFAGCFTDGELPMVGAALRQMVADDHFRDSLYVRQVARILIEDRTFADNLLVLKDILPVVFDHIGIHSNSDLQLPKGGGAEGLGSYCLSRLGDDDVLYLPSAQLFAAVVGSNHDAAATKRAWMAGISSPQKDEARAWSCLTGALGVQGSLTYSERLTAISRQPDLVSGLAIPAVMETTTARQASVLNAAAYKHAGSPQLQVSIMSQGLRTTSDAAQIASTIKRLCGLHLRGQLTSDHRLRTRRGDGESSTDLPGLFDGVLDKGLGSDPGFWRSLAPWQELVDLIRSGFGEDSWLGLEVASAAAAIKSKEERGEGYDDLLDTTTDLTLRMRYARLRPNATRWWTAQARLVSTELDRNTVAAGLALWGSPAVIHILSSVYSLDHLDDAVMCRLISLRALSPSYGLGSGVRAEPNARLGDRSSLLCSAGSYLPLDVMLSYNGDDVAAWYSIARSLQIHFKSYMQAAEDERDAVNSLFTKVFQRTGLTVRPRRHQAPAGGISDLDWYASNALSVPTAIATLVFNQSPPRRAALVDIAHHDEWYPVSERSLLGM